MKIPNKEDMKRLNEEYAAHEENRHFDVKRSIKHRTMTRKAYLCFSHGVRLLRWHLGQGKFVAGAYIGF